MLVKDKKPRVSYAFPLAAKNAHTLDFSDSNMVDFLKGFGIGLGVRCCLLLSSLRRPLEVANVSIAQMEFGNIAECVADAYPLAYLWNVSFSELDEGFARWNLSLIVQVSSSFLTLACKK
jgi:hypothetical protein